MKAQLKPTRSGQRYATSVKVPDEDWDAFLQEAHDYGMTASALLSMLVKMVAQKQIRMGLTVNAETRGGQEA